MTFAGPSQLIDRRTLLGFAVGITCTVYGCSATSHTQGSVAPKGEARQQHAEWKAGQIELGRESSPRALTLDSEGGIWCSINGGNVICHILPGGDRQEISISGSVNSVDSFAFGANDLLWFSGLAVLGYIEDGSAYVWRTSGPETGIGVPTGIGAAQGGIWYIDVGVRSSLVQILRNGALARHRVDLTGTPGRAELVGTSDGSVWAMVRDSGLIRLSSDGRVNQFDIQGAGLLAHRETLWTTLPEQYAVGRISSDGAVETIKVSSVEWLRGMGPGYSRVWFYTDNGVGWVDDDMVAHILPVPDAGHIVGVAESADNTLYAADRDHDCIWVIKNASSYV